MTLPLRVIEQRPAICAPALMHVVGISKSYGEQRALAEITFSVNAGEVIGLIGPNGAGKTTLLVSIAGLLPIDAGEVIWRGSPLVLSQRRERIFYLPDGLRPWEDQFVLRVIGFFAASYGRSESFMADTVATLGLEPVLEKRVQALSKG